MERAAGIALLLCCLSCSWVFPDDTGSSATRTVLCVGDSNTQRSSAVRIDTYCDLSRHDMFNAGRAGTTSGDWANAQWFNVIVPDRSFEVCSIMLGTNDAIVGVSSYQYTQNIKMVVRLCRTRGASRIVLHTPLSDQRGTNDARIIEYGYGLKAYAATDSDIRIGQDMFELQLQGFFRDWMDDWHIGIRDHINLVSRTDRDFDYD